MKRTETVSPAQSLIRILFLVYCGLMLWLLFGQRMEGGHLDINLDGNGENLNFVPFETVRLYWHLLQNGASQALLRHAIVNLVGNVVMFIPLGFFLPKLWQKQRKLWRTLLTTALIILLVELTQLFTLVGSCDTDDLILNVLGAAIGYGGYKILIKTGLSK